MNSQIVNLAAMYFAGFFTAWMFSSLSGTAVCQWHRSCLTPRSTNYGSTRRRSVFEARE